MVTILSTRNHLEQEFKDFNKAFEIICSDEDIPIEKLQKCQDQLHKMNKSMTTLDCMLQDKVMDKLKGE